MALADELDIEETNARRQCEPELHDLCTCEAAA